MTQGYEPWNPGPANQQPPSYGQPDYQQPGYPQQPGYEQPTYQQPGYPPGYVDPGYAQQPPATYGGGYPPAAGGGGGGGGTRNVIVAVVAAVLVVAVGVGVFLFVNRKSSDKAGPAVHTTQVPSTPPTSPLFPTTPKSGPTTPTTPGTTPGSTTPASTPPSGTWADYSSFTDLVGSAPGDTSGAFSSARCTLDSPLPVDGMLDQIVCNVDDPSLIFAVERFSSAAAVQSYQTDLIGRNYSHIYWTVDSQKVGMELTAPDSADYLDILSTMCGHPTYMVDFYARKTDTTLTTLHDDYWAKGPFPNESSPAPCS